MRLVNRSKTDPTDLMSVYVPRGEPDEVQKSQ
jgi:hypothetical protein